MRLASVLSTQTWSLPPPPKIWIDWMPMNDTIRPAPATYVLVTMNVSSIGVPSMTSVFTPVPPMMITGPFCRYS